VLCRLCMVLGPSPSVTELRILAEPAMVFILALLRLEEEVEVRSVPPGLSVVSCGGRGSRLLSQACLRAAVGVIRVAGSHSRHRRMKSRKRGSSQPLRAVCSSLEPGGPRGLPRRLRPPLRTVVPSGNVVAVQYRGYPFEEIKFLALFDWSNSFCGGMPSSSIMHDS